MADQVLISAGTVSADNIIAKNAVNAPSISAGSVTVSDSLHTNSITGDIDVDGNIDCSQLSTNAINVSGVAELGTTRITGSATLGETTVSSSLTAASLTSNGDITSQGNITVRGNLTFSGDNSNLTAVNVTVDNLSADTITGDAAVNGDVSTSSLTSGTTTVSGEATLGATTITGDVTINGGMDTGLNGDPVVTINTNSFTISHKVWFNNTTQSTIAVLPGVWNNAIKTCYLKTNIPVTLTGVIRIDDNPEMESGKTYIFALQQIDETNIIANIAYSVTI